MLDKLDVFEVDIAGFFAHSASVPQGPPVARCNSAAGKWKAATARTELSDGPSLLHRQCCNNVIWLTLINRHIVGRPSSWNVQRASTATDVSWHYGTKISGLDVEVAVGQMIFMTYRRRKKSVLLLLTFLQTRTWCQAGIAVSTGPTSTSGP